MTVGSKACVRDGWSRPGRWKYRCSDAITTTFVVLPVNSATERVPKGRDCLCFSFVHVLVWCLMVMMVMMMVVKLRVSSSSSSSSMIRSSRNRSKVARHARMVDQALMLQG
jgi:hypothetical protein